MIQTTYHEIRAWVFTLLQQVSYRKAAEITGVDKKTLHKIVSSKHYNPTLRTIEKIKEAMRKAPQS